MLGECLLGHSDNLSKALQSKRPEDGKLTVETLETLRNDAAFGLFREKVNVKGKALDVSKPQLPRRKKPPNTYNPKTEQEYYRCVYFEALD